METLIDQIRAAIADDASDDVRQAGAKACHSILSALDTRRGPRDASSSIGSTVTPPAPTSATAPPTHMPTAGSRSVGELPALVALRAVPRGQILDYVIERLRALQPEAQSNVAVASAIGALRNFSLDQIVDLGIARLQTALAPRPALAPTSLPEGTRVIRLAPVERSRRVP